MNPLARHRPPFRHWTVAAAALALVACGKNTPSDPIEAGRQAAQQQDYATAVVQFKDVLQKKPDERAVRVDLGRALLKTGDAAGAQVEWTKAQEQGEPAAKMAPLIVEALARQSDYKRIVTQYAAMKLDDPAAQAQLQLQVGDAYAALGDAVKAEQAWKAAEAAAPESVTAQMLRSRRLLDAGKTAEALEAIEAALKVAPDNVDAWTRKGGLLLAAGKEPAAAAEAWQKAIALDKGASTAYLLLIQQRLQAGDTAGAQKQYEAMAKALPKDAWTVYAAALIAFSNGQNEKARDILLKLLQVVPDNAPVQALAGYVALRTQEGARALSHFAKALQLQPKLAVARQGLAQAQLRQGQPARALETLALLLREPRPEPRTLQLAGEAELALGNAAAAQRHFEAAVAAAPQTATGARTSLAMLRLSQGRSQEAFSELSSISQAAKDVVAEQAAFAARLQRREYGSALELADAIGKKLGQPGAAQELRGRVFLAQRKFPEARAAFEAQQKADAKDQAAVCNLAAVDLLERKPDAARKRLQDAVKADPKNGPAWLALAKLQGDQNAPLEEVKELYASAISAAPRDPAPRLELIALTLRKRLYKDALAAAQDAQAAIPNDPTVLDAVGRAQMESGNVEQAITSFRSLASLTPNAALPYTRLGDIYRLTGRREQAEVALRRAVELEPDLAAAQVALLDLLITSKRQADAQVVIDKLVKDAPRQVGNYSLVSSYYLRAKAPDKALGVLRDGYNATRNPVVALQLHHLLGFQQQFDEASRLAADYLKAQPSDLRFRINVAELALKRERWTDALAQFEEIAKLQPDHLVAANNVAALKAKLKQPGAVAAAKRALELSGENAMVLDTLAGAQAAEGATAEALATQKRALALAPDEPALQLNLAKLALQSGDKALARQQLTALQRMGSRFRAQDEVTKLMQAAQ